MAVHGLVERDLVRHRGRAIDRKELLQHVWGYAARDVETRTVDMHIARLREKVEENPSKPSIILTVRSKGYTVARQDGPTS